MAGLNEASRRAITNVLQEWREAFDEHDDCQRQLTIMSGRMEALTLQASEASEREEVALQKFNAMSQSHAEDPVAVDEINSIVAKQTEGIMGVRVVSGGGSGEAYL